MNPLFYFVFMAFPLLIKLIYLNPQDVSLSLL